MLKTQTQANPRESPDPDTAQDGARHLIPYLLSSACSPSPSFVRVLDKSMVIPAIGVSTTYIDAACKQAFKSGTESGKLEYLQGNLLTEGEHFAVIEARALATSCLGRKAQCITHFDVEFTDMLIHFMF